MKVLQAERKKCLKLLRTNLVWNDIGKDKLLIFRTDGIIVFFQLSIDHKIR